MRDMVIVEYSSEYGPELVKMWRASFERAVGVSDPHPLSEQLQYLEEKVVLENRVLVVLEETTLAVVGFMASTPERISQLYVHVDYQGQGVGSMLVGIAKQHSHGRLRLFTFEANKNAQRFYERHGFKVKARGYEKEWQLADIEYEWTAAEAAT
jgi:ribosomal protein S18 acetylase RimI-like enzyme